MPRPEEQLGTTTSKFYLGSHWEEPMGVGSTGMLTVTLKHMSKRSEKTKKKKVENNVNRRPCFPVQSRNF